MARVLVVDDAAFMRKMVSDALVKGGHEVVGEAGNGNEAVARYQELRPEVTTLDITMPEKDGLAALQEIIGARSGRPRDHVLGPRAGVQGARVDQDRREGLRGEALPAGSRPRRGGQSAELAFSRRGAAEYRGCMKASTPIGIVVGIVGILAGAAMEGTPLGGLLNVPALLIILGGVAGVSIATSGMEVMKLMPTLYKKAMTPEFPDQPARVRQLVGYAEKARKEGLLALEPEIAAIDDEFTKKGLQLVVDGTDPDLVREVLEVEIESMEARHRVGQKLFKDAGGYAPTIGVLGTVMGLLHVMQLLQTPELLGPAIAGAFMATLYGVGSANIIFMPVAGRLAALTQSEAADPHDGHRGHPGHPGRREPARRRRAPARLPVRPPTARPRRARAGRTSRPCPTTWRRRRRSRWPRASATRRSTTRSIPTSAGS